jgi:hypothetical protein
MPPRSTSDCRELLHQGNHTRANSHQSFRKATNENRMERSRLMIWYGEVSVCQPAGTSTYFKRALICVSGQGRLYVSKARLYEEQAF